MDETKKNMSYGETFRRLRLTFGLKQKDLASSGLSVQTVSRFEKDATRLGVRHADALLGFLPATLFEYVQSNVWLPLDGFDGFLNYLGLIMVQPGERHLLARSALNARITYARSGEEKYLLRAVMLSASSDDRQRRRERAAVMRHLLVVRSWTNYEYFLFRRALCGTLELDDSRQLWTKIADNCSARSRLNQRRQLLQVDALLAVLRRAIDEGDYRLGRQALTVLHRLDGIGGDTGHLMQLRTLTAELEMRDPNGNVDAGRRQLQDLIAAAEFLGDGVLVSELSETLVTCERRLRGGK